MIYAVKFKEHAGSNFWYWEVSQANKGFISCNSGYMAPEYVMHGHLSVKADVFSFGVLILELVSGQKNSTFDINLDAQNLLEWVSS